MLRAKYRLILFKLKTIGLEKVLNQLDFLLYHLNWPVNVGNHENVLLFLGEHLPPRIGRMVKWLNKMSNHSIVLMCHKNGFSKEYIEKGVDHVYLFRNEWHMKRILRKMRSVKILHGFAPKSKFPYLAKEYLKVPYVHDMQDVYSIYHEEKNIKSWLRKELPFEKACIKEADGIVAHSLELNQVKGKKQEQQRIFFPLYCDEMVFQPVKAKVAEQNTYHIAYAGGVAGSHRDPKHYGNIQFHRLIEKLTSQGMHFHLFPSPTNVKSDWEEYEKLDKENPLFHFHNPVPQTLLAKELSKFDFGILPFFKSLSDLPDLKLKYATSLKLFNYLEAGLPVIVSSDIIYQNWIAARYGTAITLTEKNLDDLKSILDRSDYGELTHSVSSSRTILSLGDNIPRLLSFYESILG